MTIRQQIFSRKTCYTYWQSSYLVWEPSNCIITRQSSTRGKPQCPSHNDIGKTFIGRLLNIGLVCISSGECICHIVLTYSTFIIDFAMHDHNHFVDDVQAAGRSSGCLRPHIRYLLSKNKTTLSLPVDVLYPLAAQAAR